jgi:hypothetical protein
MPTRSLFLPDTQLASWTGLNVYLFDKATQTTIPVGNYPCTGNFFNFYEVSVIAGQGSWWLPTVRCTATPPVWLQDVYGGIEDLAATGHIWTQIHAEAIVRPVQLLWWIPQTTLDNANNTPGSTAGQVSGHFPTTTGGLLMARYRVQLKSAFINPHLKTRFFDHILTNDDLRNEMNSGKTMIHVTSSVTQLQYYIPVDTIAYVADISTVSSS